MLHDFAIDKEEDFYLIFREVSINILVVELNGGIKQCLPALFGLVGLADFNGVIQYFFDLNIMSHLVIKVDLILIKPFPEYGINPFHGNLDCLNGCTGPLIEIFETIIDLVLFTDFDTLINGEVGVVLEGL